MKALDVETRALFVEGVEVEAGVTVVDINPVVQLKKKKQVWNYFSTLVGYIM